jgi:hypothetical protein
MLISGVGKSVLGAHSGWSPWKNPTSRANRNANFVQTIVCGCASLAWGQVVFDGIHPILPRFAFMAGYLLFGLGICYGATV